MRTGKVVECDLHGYKDLKIIEGRAPYGGVELSMTQGAGGILFSPKDIPEIIAGLNKFVDGANTP